MEEIENPASWDFDRAEMHGLSKGNRVVVSVAFPRTGYELVTTCADRLGMRVSEFIREAALEKAARQTGTAILASVSGPFVGVIIFRGRISPASASSTRVSGAQPLDFHDYGQFFTFVNEPTTV